MNRIKYNYSIPILIATAFLIASCTTEQQNNPASNYNEEKKINKTQSVEVVNPQLRSFVAEVLITGTAQPSSGIWVTSNSRGSVRPRYGIQQLVTVNII